MFDNMDGDNKAQCCLFLCMMFTITTVWTTYLLVAEDPPYDPRAEFIRHCALNETGEKRVECAKIAAGIDFDKSTEVVD